MTIRFTCIYRLVFLILICGTLRAQVKIEIVPDAPGKLITHPNTFKFLQSFKVLSNTKASSLANSSDKIMEAVRLLPQIHSPIGYDADVNVAAVDFTLKEKEPRLKIYCQLRYLIKDSRYTGIKKSLDGCDIMILVNAFDLFHQMGNYWQKCDELKLPIFFEAPQLSDSTNDYIAFKYKGDPLRIVLANDKPLFVPLTRKEFVQFLVARDQRYLKEETESISTLQKGENNIRKMMATQNEEDKKYSASALKSMDYNISEIHKNIATTNIHLQQCNDFLQTASNMEKAAPARVDYDKKSKGPGIMANLDILVPPGRGEGTALVKVNPEYYNYSPQASAAQMLATYYVIPDAAYKTDYLQQATLDIFNHLDYHALKMSMR